MVLFGLNDIRLVYDKPVPEPGPGEALVKVAACGICGTDVRIFTQGIAHQPPYGSFTPGHEWTGVVVKLGENVDEFEIGDRVAVQAHHGCGRCRNCLAGSYTNCLNYAVPEKGQRATGMTCDGGFAEYAVHNVSSLYQLPDSVDLVDAAYVTTLGTAFWALDASGGYIVGDTVLVSGPGPIGLSMVQACRVAGASKVILTGTREERLAIGRKVGADYTINVRETADPLSEIMRLTNGKGCEHTFDCAGSKDSANLCIHATMPAHVMSAVSRYGNMTEIDLDYAVFNGIRITTTRGEGGDNCRRALAAMAQGKIQVKPIMTHSFPIEEFQKGYDYFVNRIDGAMKVTIIP